MAFLVADAKAKVVADSRAEQRSFWAENGIMCFGSQTRVVYELRVMWPIDMSGGEVPPLTWSYGGRTYAYRSGSPGIGWENLNGVYTAIYVDENPWADA